MKHNIPKLRFPGFKGVWERRRLSEFGKAAGGVPIEDDFLPDRKYKVISIGSYSQESRYVDQGIRADKNKRTESRILNKGNLAMILNDKTRAGNIIGRVLLIDADDSYVYNQRTERIEVYQDRFAPEFLYQLLNADAVRLKIINASQGVAQIYVNWPVISKIQYNVPASKDEQVKIGEFFGKIDHLIQLQEKRLRLLQNLKKALLHRMLPENGKDVPELRLKEFAGEWEVKKVGDVFEVKRGKPLAAENMKAQKTEDFKYPVYSSQTKGDGIVGFYDKLLFENALTWTTDGTYAGTVNYRDCKFYCTLHCGVLLNDGGYANRCMAEMLNKRVGKYIDPAGQPTLKSNAMSEIELPFPSLPEQQKIASFLEKLERLQSAAERELDNARALKKGLLREMLV